MSKRPPYERQAALGEAIKALRREKTGLSQKDLAERIDMSPSWLSRIESGDYDPPWSNIIRVAKGLGVSLAELEKAIAAHERSSSPSDQK